MPKVMINCAMSADGKIALPSRVQTRISSQEDMARVHQLRAKADAILVGIGTVLADDPSLTVKQKYAPGSSNPIRVVLDSKARVPSDAKVLDDRAPTIIAAIEGIDKDIDGAELFNAGIDEVDLHALMTELDSRGVKTLMVEGGSKTIWSFFNAGLVDEYKVFIGSLVIGGKDSPTPAGGAGASCLDDTHRLTLEKNTVIGDGILLEYSVGR